MKTILKIASLVFAAGVPSAIAAGFVGLSVPAALDAPTLFGAFVASLVTLTALSDYSRHQDRLARVRVGAVVRRAKHPLAA